MPLSPTTSPQQSWQQYYAENKQDLHTIIAETAQRILSPKTLAATLPDCNNIALFQSVSTCLEGLIACCFELTQADKRAEAEYGTASEALLEKATITQQLALLDAMQNTYDAMKTYFPFMEDGQYHEGSPKPGRAGSDRGKHGRITASCVPEHNNPAYDIAGAIAGISTSILQEALGRKQIVHPLFLDEMDRLKGLEPSQQPR